MAKSNEEIIQEARESFDRTRAALPAKERSRPSFLQSFTSRNGVWELRDADGLLIEELRDPSLPPLPQPSPHKVEHRTQPTVPEDVVRWPALIDLNKQVARETLRPMVERIAALEKRVARLDALESALMALGLKSIANSPQDLDAGNADA